MTKRSYILIACLAWTLVTLGQQKEYPLFLKAASSWGSEIIPFPVAWAPRMTINGYEELRFAPDWSNPESPIFWSLVMGWSITSDHKISVTTIEENLKYYFDGLMKPNHWAKEFPDPIVSLDIIHTQESTGIYEGELDVFDGFHTGKNITLRIQAVQEFHPNKNITYVLIRFSPQHFDHQVWDNLKSIVVKQ